MNRFNDARDWFFEKRLGLFVHWGLYAINGLQEQEQQRYNVPASEYVKLIDKFNPASFDPAAWLDMAQESGFEYMVFTAKHHDGFCLWNTAQSKFNVMNSPYGKDVLKMLADECHKRSFPLEVYYSVVDWHFPAYPNIGRHHEIVTEPASHNWDAYMDFLKAQVKEICSNYGKIHGIWWDMNVPQHKDASVHEMIHSLQPAALVNNRGFGDGDYSTPERDFDPEGANPDSLAFKRPTEACQSVGVNSWGYRKEEDYFTVAYFQKKIASTLAMGGNFLLNAGPDANGIFPEEALSIFRGISSWYKNVREALTAVPAPGTLENRRVLTTKKDDVLYVICPEGLDSSALSLAPFKNLPRKVTLFNSGEKIPFTLEPTVYERGKGELLRLRHIPSETLEGTIPVFKIEF